MIYVRDKGRMCNNILQYGHLYAWGREHGRQTMSMRFAYKYQYFHICDTPHHNFITYLFAKYAAKLRLVPVVQFNDINQDTTPQEQLMLSRRHVVAEGWFVHWFDLFLKYKQDIIQLFEFNSKVKQAVDALLAPLPECDLRLGVHIRRGDYRRWHDGRYFYTDEQYISYIRQFLAMHPGKRVSVFVCGNDPELDTDKFRAALTAQNHPETQPAPENMPADGTKKRATLVSVAFPNGNPGEDLCLLSRCNYLMGAPSTFTLVASMYHDTPLCWMMDPTQPLSPSSFGRFDYLFRHII